MTVEITEQQEHRLTGPGRRTRERIVEAAAELIYRQGVFSTTIPEVQQAAHVSASQIYHYFGDKDGLVRAVIGHQIDAVLDMQPLLNSLDSIGAIRAWRDEIAARQESQGYRGGCEIGSLASELSDHNEVARVDLVAAFDRWEEPIRRGLALMQERGQLRAEADPAGLATALLTAVQGGLLLTQVRRSIDSFRSVTDAVIGHIESFAA